MPLHGDAASFRARWIALRREARAHRGAEREWRLRAARKIDLWLLHGWTCHDA